MHGNQEVLVLIIICGQQTKVLRLVFPFILLERVTWLHKISIITDLKWGNYGKKRNSEHWKTLYAFGDVINK